MEKSQELFLFSPPASWFPSLCIHVLVLCNTSSWYLGCDSFQIRDLHHKAHSCTLSSLSRCSLSIDFFWCEWEIINSCIFFTYIYCSLKDLLFSRCITTAIVCLCARLHVCAQSRLFVADDCRAFVFLVSFLLIQCVKNSHNALWSPSAAALHRLTEEGGVEAGAAQDWWGKALDSGSVTDAEPGQPE